MIPATTQPFRFSKPALALILASSLLAAILAVTTVRNMNRGERLLQTFLVQESLTLIRSFEAGARTSMSHHQAGSGTNPLQTLVEETTKEKSVAYIRIVDEKGHIVAESGNLPPSLAIIDIQQILNRNGATTRTLQGRSVFELARIYDPLPPVTAEQRWGHAHRNKGISEAPKKIRKLIMVGLTTHDFEASRKADRNQTFLMGALLFLLGNAGLYFLFLYQSICVSRSTLANMKIYTKNVIESMPAGLITVDLQGLVVSSNSRAEKLLSQDIREMKGTAFTTFFPELHTDFKQQAQHEQELLCHNASGEEIPLKLATSPLLDHNGCNNGLVIILRDIREIKKIQQQLELSRRLASLGRMAAGVAHEIRNPLGTLRGFAQYFSREAREGTNGKHYANLMISEVDRINHIISSLLQFARAREPRPILIQTEKLFEKVASLMEADFTVHQILFNQHHDPGMQLFVDPDLLLQVLLNLLKNSVNATDCGGTVELTARLVNDESILEVSDSGCGMTTEEQQKLFDPFFSTRNDGTGLGLAATHQIVEQHNGRIEVESTLEQGTHMQVILPGAKQ